MRFYKLCNEYGEKKEMTNVAFVYDFEGVGNSFREVAKAWDSKAE